MALLLIVTYRSPVLWLVPLAVIGFADRVAAVVGTAVADAVGMNPDGSTSGITSVLVFGAGTNYALLLISRYREELGRNDNHRAALRVAVRQAGPAILASNATVVLALLTLVFASSPSTRSLGVQAASGLVVAAVFVLLVLPPLLALFGKRLFWPFIPQVGAKPLTDSGIWHRIAASVARRPGRVAVVAIAGLALLCTGLLTTPVGLSQTEQFRVQAESVSGYQTTGRTLSQRADRPGPRRRLHGPRRRDTNAPSPAPTASCPQHRPGRPRAACPSGRWSSKPNPRPKTRSKPLMHCGIRCMPSIRVRWSADPMPRPATPAPPPMLGEYQAADEAVHAALDAFRQVGSASGEAWALQNLAWIAFTKGRTDEAERRLDVAVATFRELGDGVGIAWAQGLLAFVKFQQGDREAAEQARPPDPRRGAGPG